MSLEELFKKREEEVKAFGDLNNNPSFATCGVLIEKISHVVMDYLHENGIDGKIDRNLIQGVYFAHCWSLARFSKVFDKCLGIDTSKIVMSILELCLQGENINDQSIELKKEGN